MWEDEDNLSLEEQESGIAGAEDDFWLPDYVILEDIEEDIF